MAAIWLPSKWYQEPSRRRPSMPMRSASGSLDSTMPTAWRSANSRAGAVAWGTSGLGALKGMAAKLPSRPWSGGINSEKPSRSSTSLTVFTPQPQRGV